MISSSLVFFFFFFCDSSFFVLQQEDLVNLGKLMVALACNTVLALQRDNIQTALELINRTYSRDLSMLVVCLLTAQRIKSINDVMPMIGAR